MAVSSAPLWCPIARQSTLPTARFFSQDMDLSPYDKAVSADLPRKASIGAPVDDSTRMNAGPGRV